MPPKIIKGKCDSSLLDAWPPNGWNSQRRQMCGLFKPSHCVADHNLMKECLIQIIFIQVAIRGPMHWCRMQLLLWLRSCLWEVYRHVILIMRSWVFELACRVEIVCGLKEVLWPLHLMRKNLSMRIGYAHAKYRSRPIPPMQTNLLWGWGLGRD